MIPEVLLLSISSIKPNTGFFLLEELYSTLLPPFLSQISSHLSLIQELWKLNRDIVVKSIAEMYKKDPVRMNLSIILDLSLNIPESLPDFLYS